MEALLTVMVALLAGGLLYLWLQLRHYQRVDYSYVIRQDERERQTLARLAALEQLVGDIGELDRLHRADLAEMLSSSQAQLELQADNLRRMLAASRSTETEASAETTQGSKARKSGRSRIQQAESRRGELLFLRNERQWEIAARLGNAETPREISRELGISLHEVELVRSVIAGQRRSA